MRINKLLLVVCLLLAVAASGYSQNKPDALLLYQQGKFEEAASVCKDEIKETPLRTDAYVVLGWSLVALRRPAEALEWANKCLGFAPNDQRVIHIAAEALYMLGRYDEALIKCREYVKYGGPKLALMYYYMGMIYIARKEYVLADIALSTAVHHYANEANWWERLGFARENANDAESALAAYNEALKRNPNHPEAIKGKDRVRLNRSEP
ncbi:MAG: tetratricopeptide repeat protein [Spirochaetales bacterium]|nr:tetratricopeptide repeat protein [Spirochaetales bacterium]